MNKNFIFKLLKNEKSFTSIVDSGEVTTKVGTSKSISPKFTTGFTLIELLVVIAIIGILSSVIAISVSSAREKNKVAAIKSTLKQIYNQAEIEYVKTGDYNNLFYSSVGYPSGLTYYSVCAGPLEKIAQPLIDRGVFISCYSNFEIEPGKTVFQRFGATAFIYDENEFKAWSIDQNGIVKWDEKGVDSNGSFIEGDDLSMNWQSATDACIKSGGRLPSLEQLRTLSHAWQRATQDLSITDPDPFAPRGFLYNYYWSSNTIMLSGYSYPFGLIVDTRLRYPFAITNSTINNSHFRCVR